jgi:hypothetical protein
MIRSRTDVSVFRTKKPIWGWSMAIATKIEIQYLSKHRVAANKEVKGASLFTKKRINFEPVFCVCMSAVAATVQNDRK